MPEGHSLRKKFHILIFSEGSSLQLLGTAYSPNFAGQQTRNTECMTMDKTKSFQIFGRNLRMYIRTVLIYIFTQLTAGKSPSHMGMVDLVQM